MEIDCKEQKAPKMTEQIPLVQLITIHITRKRPTWSRDTLQDAKTYSIDEPYHEEQMAPPVVRQATPPSIKLHRGSMETQSEPDIIES
jgi:hypothetical protein